MKVAVEVLKALREAEGVVSGERLSSALGISRAAIWKHIRRLRQEGYEIEAQRAKGYRLKGSPKGFSPMEIVAALPEGTIWKGIHFFERVGSTNDIALQLARGGAPEGELVIADEQTKGRGRMGRRWHSPKGMNLYFSFILRPPLPPSHVPLITLMASLALAEAMEGVAEVRPQIKWPNDLLLGGKKVAGILTEADAQMDLVKFVIVGVGVNVNMRREEMPGELRSFSTSLLLERGEEVNRLTLLLAFLKDFDKWYRTFVRGEREEVLRKWEERSAVRGRRVEVVFLDEEIRGVAQGLDRDGALLVRTEEGEMRRVVAGDLKVKEW